MIVGIIDMCVGVLYVIFYFGVIKYSILCSLEKQKVPD